jgi:hypothetical protein
MYVRCSHARMYVCKSLFRFLLFLHAQISSCDQEFSVTEKAKISKYDILYLHIGKNLFQSR